jgi:hypothetical protein
VKLTDLRTILTWMGPDYLHEAAQYHNPDDVVAGAVPAYDEVRQQVREFIHYVRRRDDTTLHDLKLSLLVRAVGLTMPRKKYVHPIRVPGREEAVALWPQGENIPGAAQVECGDVEHPRLARAVVRAVSNMLDQNPRMNRAILMGSVYQRTTAEVMYHVSLGKGRGLRTVVVNPQGRDDAWLVKRMRRALRHLLLAEKHELVDGVLARDVASWMLTRWAGRFLTSHAGAMVSTLPKLEQGWPALAPNGVPLAIGVCRIQNGRAWLTSAADHRAFDGDEDGVGDMFEFLAAEVPRIMGEDR